MPGHVAHQEVPAKRTLVIRPIQANLNIDDNLIGKMDTYCKFKCGHHKGKSEVCKDGGKWPFWNSVVKVTTKDELYVECQLKNKKLGGLYGKIVATCKVPLRDIGPVIASEGHVTQWFEINHQMKHAGRILLDISYDTLDQVPLKNTSADPNLPHGQLPGNKASGGSNILHDQIPINTTSIYANATHGQTPINNTSVDPHGQIPINNASVDPNVIHNQTPVSNTSAIPIVSHNQIPINTTSIGTNAIHNQIPVNNISTIPNVIHNQIPINTTSVTHNTPYVAK